jgi:hypothetical protein
MIFFKGFRISRTSKWLNQQELGRSEGVINGKKIAAKIQATFHSVYFPVKKSTWPCNGEFIQ